MPDNIIRVTTEVDVSSLKSGMEDAASTIATNLEVMKAEYRAAASSISAQAKLIAASIKADVAVTEELYASLRRDVVAHREQATAIAAATVQVQAHAAAQDAVSVSTKGSNTQFAAAKLGVDAITGSTQGMVNALARGIVSAGFMGNVLKAAFPALLVFGFAEVIGSTIERIVELGRRIEETPGKTRHLFDELGESIRIENDNIQVTIDKLDIAIARLQKRPENTLALALDEARQFADKLAQSLDHALDRIHQVAKEVEVGFWQGMVSGQMPTGFITREFGPGGAFAAHMDSVIEGNNRLIDSARQLNDQGAMNAAKLQVEINLQKAYGDELKKISDQRKELASIGLAKAVFVGSPEQAIAELDSIARVIEQRRKSISLMSTEEEMKVKEAQVKAQVDANKNALSAHKKAEEDLKHHYDSILAFQESQQEMSHAQLKKYWEDALAEVKSSGKKYEDLIREMQMKIGHLNQDVNKDITRAAVADVTNQASVARKGSGESGQGAAAELTVLDRLMSKYASMPVVLDKIHEMIAKSVEDVWKEIEKTTKDGVDEEFKLWEQEQHTQQEVIDKWKATAQAYEGFASIEKEALDKVTAATIKQREERIRLHEIAIQSASDSRLGGMELQKAGIARAERLDLDTSTANQIHYLQMVRDIDNQIIQEKIRTAQAEANAEVAGSVKQAELLRKVVDLKRQADLQMYNNTTNILDRQLASYWHFFQQVQSGFSSTLTGMLTGQRTFAQGIVSIEQQMLGDFVNMVTQRIVNWIAGTATMKAVNVGFHTLMKVLHLEAAGSQIASQASAAEAGIAAAAALGAANAYAAYAEFPPLAVAMAAAAFAAIMSFSGAVAAGAAGGGAGAAAAAGFAEGGIVPRTGLILAHEKEGVMPRPLTDLLMRAATGPSSSQMRGIGASGGNTVMHLGGIHINGNVNGQKAGKEAVKEISKWARQHNIMLPS